MTQQQRGEEGSYMVDAFPGEEFTSRKRALNYAKSRCDQFVLCHPDGTRERFIVKDRNPKVKI